MNVLLVSDCSPASFVGVDHKILASRYQVDWMKFRWSFRNLAWVLTRLRWVDVVFGWFAGHHTFLPAIAARLLGKKIVIAAADYDLANEPWFNYGSMRGGLRAWINNRIFSTADAVLVPSKFSLSLALGNTVLRRTPEKVHVIPCGFDNAAPEVVSKEKLLLTVGTVNSEDWIRKGHREFIQVAARFPEVPAYLVGKLAERRLAAYIRAEVTANVSVTGYVSDSDLQGLFSRSQVYAQLSYMEGFGCSVAEAMLARCVPVVTRRGALPEVVGDCGYYADWGNIAESCAAVEHALADGILGSRARERVLDCFPLEKRRRDLLGIMSWL